MQVLERLFIVHADLFTHQDFSLSFKNSRWCVVCRQVKARMIMTRTVVQIKHFNECFEVRDFAGPLTLISRHYTGVMLVAHSKCNALDDGGLHCQSIWCVRSKRLELHLRDVRVTCVYDDFIDETFLKKTHVIFTNH